MKYWFRFFVLMAVLLTCASGLLTARVQAQPACEGNEEHEVALLITLGDNQDETPWMKFEILYAELQPPTDAESLIITLQGINDLQMLWWNEIVPNLSECARKENLTRMFGRLVDETLIFASMTQIMVQMSLREDFSTEDDLFATYTMMTHDHGKQVTELHGQLQEILDEMIQSANGEDFAQCVQGDPSRIPGCFHHLLSP